MFCLKKRRIVACRRRLGNVTAKLAFSNGRESGSVHVQFTPMEQLSYGVLGRTKPQWVYLLQPAGIEAEGDVDVTIRMPALLGSYEYVPPDGTYVVMLALDAESRLLVPVGVGRVDNRQVAATVNANRMLLDVIGYTFVPYEAQSLLREYAAGQIDLATLTGRLQDF